MDAGTNVEALLEHADWVRALARTLVADSASAEDVEQEAWLAALRHPPRDASNPRGWLGTVVRNAARKLARERVRRAAREADVARDEALPSAAELVEQTNLQRELAGLVVELDEPYRSTLLLRFFQGLEAAEIAARTGVPVATVRTRVQRGLASLREKLDRRHGDRATWLAAFAPLAKSHTLQGSAVAGLGAWIMAVSLKWAIAASVAVAVGAWWLVHDASVSLPTTSDGKGANVELASLPNQVDAPVAAVGAASGRSAVATPVGAATSGATPPTKRFAGRCIGVDGAPLAGIEFEWLSPFEARVRPDGTVQIGESWIPMTDELRDRLSAEPELVDGFVAEFAGFVRVREALLGEPIARPRATSREDGAFELEAPQADGELVLDGDAWILLGTLRDDLDPLPLLVFAPRIELAGDVVDAEGVPLADGSVELNVALQSLELPGRRITHVEIESGWTSSVDAAGRFRLERAPGVAGALLHASRWDANGRSWHARAPIDGSSRLDLHLVAELQVTGRFTTIRGVVDRTNGVPVAGAVVRFGQDSAITDASGAFELGVTVTPRARTPLTAALRGQGAATALYLEDIGDRDGSVDGIRLTLADPLAPIRGRVLDVDGAPAAGWEVELFDGTPCGTSSTTLEGDSCGRYRFGSKLGADGAFELGGLLDRAYRVRAWDPKTLAMLVSDPVWPGDELELRVRPELTHPRLAGRVVTLDGQPLGAVTVQSRLVVAESGGMQHTISRGTVTDASGRFAFADVGRGVELLLFGEGVAWTPYELAVDADVENLTLVARREFRFRLELVESDPADHYAVENAAGERLNMTYETPDLKSGGRVLGRAHGSFPLTTVPEEATTLVLLQGETVLRKVPLQLRWRELTVITP